LTTAVLQDWTSGVAGLIYQECRRCGHRWTFTRDFCPVCSGVDIEARRSGGSGIVEAATTLHRAPLDTLRNSLPYRVVLVITDENLRFMGHAREHDLHIGEPVEVSFAPFGELAFIPVFGRRRVSP
jgi:uncharacterized OB-fold protein